MKTPALHQVCTSLSLVVASRCCPLTSLFLMVYFALPQGAGGSRPPLRLMRKRQLVLRRQSLPLRRRRGRLRHLQRRRHMRRCGDSVARLRRCGDSVARRRRPCRRPSGPRSALPRFGAPGFLGRRFQCVRPIPWQRCCRRQGRHLRSHRRRHYRGTRSRRRHSLSSSRLLTPSHAGRWDIGRECRLRVSRRDKAHRATPGRVARTSLPFSGFLPLPLSLSPSPSPSLSLSPTSRYVMLSKGPFLPCFNRLTL
jgi:hypothetical protein